PTPVHPAVVNGHTFGTQPLALFLPGPGIGSQAEPPARAYDPMPGQASVVGQLRHQPSDPACRPAEAGQRGQLTIAGHLARRYLGHGQVNRGSPRLGVVANRWAAVQNLRSIISGHDRDSSLFRTMRL